MEEESDGGGEAELSGARVGGEPARADCERAGDESLRASGAGGGGGDGAGDSGREEAGEAGWRQWVDTREFVEQLKELNVTPHVAQNVSGRRSAVDGRRRRHEGYWMSQKRRKLVEEFFGWAKVVAGLRKVKLRGREKVGWLFTLAAAAYNLVRMRNLMVATA